MGAIRFSESSRWLPGADVGRPFVRHRNPDPFLKLNPLHIFEKSGATFVAKNGGSDQLGLCERSARRIMRYDFKHSFFNVL